MDTALNIAEKIISGERLQIDDAEFFLTTPLDELHLSFAKFSEQRPRSNMQKFLEAR